MKRRTILLLATLLATPALAQGITITRPSTPPATTPTAVPALTDVPAGWRVVSGRIRAPQAVRLPAGSTVTVRLEDITRLNAPRTALLTISFPASRLSTPYQLQFNPVRLDSRRVYAVTARVYGPQGRLLYRSAAAQELPPGRNVVMDLRVVPVR
ncbi:YbaY family lipoprotein [Deinococcus sp. YIM 77859]|uniref:YbaY family lipoprotein n=1 Tax=Deinococcus sp. YIM 77859 TaxID=1540221 RepID=UPI000558B1B3|nr:YbaY family lipoprotein [Deinococcus sp. YIM 77859]